ncbi:CHAD domain-containing protein [Pontixanthobacter gangjinensis]|uniref:CHAD domain-containing protein n=1 Tax=Christiangramia aestuarii TaxID=1028746 RepID=A0A7K1LSJ4_9FLAO|nr:CHAD domain-containing protein [Christiangramia aestuarii]MUP43591.1 CHAD domain-containing protein [Christiangramia aestuarii]
MTYQLDKSLPLKKNITAIASEELQGCLYSLENLNIHEAVHDIRKRLKKLRALARIVRDEMGEENYKHINIYFRDLGRELSDFRDLTAHLETIELLRERYGQFLYVNFFKPVSSQLEKERDAMEKELKKKNFFSEHLVEKLEYAQKDLVKWPVSSNDIQIILPSIERVYGRGKKALETAYANPSKENFHEWRKRVKYLWYQTLLLQETWPQFFETMEAEIHLLADFLGNDHDLMVFRQKLGSEKILGNDESRKELMDAITHQYSEILRRNARTKGELIYAEDPADFTKRIGSYTEINWN